MPTPHHRSSGKGVCARALIFATLCALAATASAAKQKPPVQYQIQTPAPPDFSALDWMVGQWTGKTIPNSPPGEMKLSINYDLEKHFIVFHEEISLAATSSVPAMEESWMGILSGAADGAGFILRIFTSHGFITRYRLTTDGAEWRLNPEGGDFTAPGWLFRRVWARTGPDEFSETVQAAPPGKGFFDYFSVKFTRVPPPAKPAPQPAKPASEPPKNSPGSLGNP